MIGGTLGIDDLRTEVILPDYQITKDVTREEDSGNAYARLPGNSTITSAAFSIGTGVQQLALSLTGLTTKSDQYQIKLLSDPSFSTSTLLGSGTVSDSWQQLAYNVSTWQGQVVKLQISSAYALGAIGVDEIGIQSITLPGWTVTGATAVVDEGNGNHFVSTNGTLLSDAFVLDPDVQQVSLRYRGDDGAADTFYVKLLRGTNFSEEIDLVGYQSAGASWQTLKIGLNLYAGETVKLKLQRHFGSIHFDDVAAGEIILPGWQPTGTEGISTGTDSYGSYVAAANSPALYIRSIPIDTGIINHPYRTDARYYAVAYDIGYSTGNLFQVFWINDQGQQYTAFQDAANSPTGYRERYFQINEAVGTSGHFVIKITGGGRVYSIADNIARQHLNEPFSYKVGMRIDTSTGAFGYQAEDLRVAGNTPLIFTRYYNGHSDRLGAMGYGWSHSYDDAGQLLSDGTTTYTYDANGNLIGAGADGFTWDWANRLTGATVNGQNTTYNYDAMNVRVGATVNGAADSFLWDRATALPLLIDDGTNAYLHGTGPMAQIDGSGTRYDLMADGLGSIRGVTDGSGALAGTADYGVFGDYRNQSGVSSRFGFTGEYFAPETGLWHLRARDLNPSLGRFLSADPVQPNAPGSQGYNPYAYVANNPTTWVDPSGYSIFDHQLTPNEAAIVVALMVSVPAAVTLTGVGVGIILLALVLACGIDDECRPTWQDANELIKQLGSSGVNTVQWTAETLNTAFAKYPLLPENSPALQVFAGLGLGAVGLDTVTDFAALISGRDPLTGRELTPRELFITWLAFSIPLVSASMMHGFADDAAELLADFRPLRNAGCSFDAETPVATDEGAVPIRAVAVGDKVLAWDESLNASGYYTVTAVWAHEDPVTVFLTINGETIETTPEHPFLTEDGAWVAVSELIVGDEVRNADGDVGTVQALVFNATAQVMYNMTVADAHTYVVGDGEWVVHIL